MFNKSKRLISMLLCLAMVLAILPVAAFAASTTIYVQPNSNWLIDGAWFAAYFFNDSGSTWASCSDADGDGNYEVAVPDGYPNVIFCRMNPADTTTLDWSNKWNQTADLTVPTDSKVVYVVDGWDKGAGQWIEMGGEPEEVEVVYYLRGDMNSWDTSTPMTQNDDGTWTVTIALAAGTYEYKAADAGWGTAWPQNADNSNATVTVAADCDVTFTLDTVAGTVTATGTGVGDGESGDEEDVAPVFYLRGTMNEWAADVDNMMSLGQDGLYTITMTLPVGEYEFKADVGDWTNSVPATSENMVIYVATECEVTFVLDYANKILSADGDGLGVKPAEEMVIEYITAVGGVTTDGEDENTLGNFMNGVKWDPAATENLMTQNGDAYTITFEDVEAGTYDFKFAANGGWDISWGTACEVVSDAEYDAWFGGNNATLTVAKDGSTVTLILDLDSMNKVDGSGAMLWVEVESPEYEPDEDDGPIDVDAFKTVIAKGDAVDGADVTFCLSADDTVTVRVTDFSVDDADAAYYVEIWNADADEMVEGGYYTETGSYDFALSGGVNYIASIKPAIYYGPTLAWTTSGTVSYKIVSNVPLGEAGGEEGGEDVDPVAPGADENNPIQFTENTYTATVPAGSTVWFAHNDYEDYMYNGMFAQQFVISGATGFAVTHSFGSVTEDDVDGAVSVAEAYCNMVGLYVFAIANNTESDQDYVVVFSDIPSEDDGGEQILADVADQAVGATEPYTVTFTIESAGTLHVVMGDANPAWRYKITDPTNTESLWYSNSSFSVGPDATFELTELGEYTIKFYAWDSVGYCPTAGTVSCTVTFTPAEGEQEVVKEEYVVSDSIMLELGDNSLTLDPNAITTIFEFCPDETGIFKFTASDANALVGYWGAGSFFVNDYTADKTNTLEQELSSVGQSIMVGVSGVEDEFVLTVERVDDYEQVEIYWEILENNELDYALELELDGDIEYIDVTDGIEDMIFVDMEGFIRYGSITGPIIVANLTDNDYMDFATAYANSPFRVPYPDEDGTVTYGVDMSEALMEYYYAESDGYVVPLTWELYYMLFELGTYRGWYSEDVMGFYLFGGVEVDPETAFLAFCGYLEGSEIVPDELGTVVKGENTFETDDDAYYGDNVIIYPAEDGVITVEVLNSDPGYLVYVFGLDSDGYGIDLGIGEYGYFVNGEGKTLFSFEVSAGCGYTINLCSAAYDEEYEGYWEVAGSISYVVTYDTEEAAPSKLATPEITGFNNLANGVQINWDAVEGAEAYRVYAKISTGWLALGTTTNTSFVYTGAKSGYTYTFAVRCVNAAGTEFTSDINETGWKQTYVAQPAISKLENTATGIKITWNAVAGAGKYRVYAKTSSGWLALGTTTSNSFVYTGAKSGYTYTFTVRALNAAGTAFVSSFNTTGWKQTYVAQPAISKLENTATGIKLTWNAVAGAGKYRIYAKISTGWLALGTTTGTSFTYTGAKSGYTYTFTVRALNAAGTAFVSSFSTTGWKQTYVAQPAISGFESAANGIKISWNAVAGAGKYRVYAKTSAGWLALGTTTGTSFTYTGAKTGLTYTFTVRALNAAGTAFVSSFSTTGWKHTYMPTPVMTKLQSTDNGIQLTWNAINGSAKYRVYVKTSSGWLAIGNTTATSFLWTGAKAGYTYTFTVRCVNAAGTAFTSAFNTTGWSIKHT